MTEGQGLEESLGADSAALAEVEGMGLLGPIALLWPGRLHRTTTGLTCPNQPEVSATLPHLTPLPGTHGALCTSLGSLGSSQRLTL